MTNPLIGSIHTLKREPKKDEAQLLLQRIAALVRPIMQKRGWKVTRLREFYPRNANLLGLNVNQGMEIRIRLRPAHDNSQFLRYEDLLGTMLHELVHIVRSPHDAEFYRTLDELKAEAEILLARGYTGDGFYSAGHKLGAGLPHSVSLHMRREEALQAIEARKRLQKLGLGGPPRKLGGELGIPGTPLAAAQKQRYTPAQMAAMAAEQRRRDEKWCGEAIAGIVEETQPRGSDDDVVVVVAVAAGGTSTTSDRGSSNRSNKPRVIVVSDSDSDSETAATADCALVVVDDD
ncbi:hypothetical protein IW140_005035 [Coemansia sp. RSA 1813]|nr:hypothetical protein EV178_005012 [Coemansia sp. RSA 1646]KAJ1769652.1 hypothetical protein LPJ74_003852 [Coemansia sp. RSA 1843]KAJ2087295.1 hypothetical protein IW138_005075 [Coemansia sp. RSA 986]KAJ2212154.1 hypothetical protein EV179_004890 [Coemansia sp. RSA 487]KAJ2566167.1 hypothetical protein IW140_005035 [Coemansia sp. RSA 1813]